MSPTSITQEVIHPDTQAVLLLCATFAKENEREVKPLTLREYNGLAMWLARQGKRPADLLTSSEEWVPAWESRLPDVERVRVLLGRGMQMAAAVERWQRLGLWVISRGEDRYPERMRRNLRSAAPALLYGAGDLTRLTLGGLAVVGSRDIEEEGLCFTRRVAERCVGAGKQIVSGGARGVDQAAITAALDAGGGAVGVLADRLDRTATSREAKEPIRDGRLTLVTPYEPEAGFTVGRAMGRNKHVYALADSALVVRFTTGEGGTWAGAVEQLGQNKSGPTFVPVYVRIAHNPEAGWKELRSRGALPFPEEEFWTGNVEEILGRVKSPPSDLFPQDLAAEIVEGQNPSEVSVPPLRQSTLSNPTALSSAANVDLPPVTTPMLEVPSVRDNDSCYSRSLPLLLESLRDEPGDKDLSKLASRLDLLPGQIKEWLKRAMGEGKVRRKKNGRRFVYVNAALGEEASLFNNGDDAA